MKNKIIHLMLAVVAATGLAACGDGSVAADSGPDPSVSALEIAVFNISAAGEEGEGGTSVEIEDGGSVILEWEVTLPEGADQENVKVTLDSKELSVHAEDLKVKDQMTIDDINVAATFTLTAEYDGKKVTKSVDVTIKEVGSALTATFTADRSEIKKGESVELCWNVSRSDASLVITGSDAKEVFKAKLDDKTASGCVTVTPEKTMAYTMKASVEGEDTVTRSVDVNVKKTHYSRKSKKEPPAPKTPPLPKAITLSTTVNGAKLAGGAFFEGEEIVIGWKATAKDAKGDSIRVTISGAADIKDRPAKGEEQVKVAGDGEYQITASGEGFKSATTVIKINLRTWNGPAKDAAGRPASAVFAKDLDTAFIGFDGDLEKGNLKIAKANADNMAADILTAPFQKLFEGFGSLGGLWNSKFIGGMDTFPVNAIAIDKSSGRLYVGTAGGVIFSDDGGDNWVMFTQGYIMDDGKATGSHKSCKDLVQDEVDMDKIISVEQVCDIVIDPEDKRFIMATDRRVRYLKNGGNAFMDGKGEPSNDEDDWWAGTPTKAGEAGNAVYGRINHDLELVQIDGKSQLYSGTDQGLFKSSDRGKTWDKVSGSPSPVYAVAVDPEEKVIYVGTDKGLSKKAIDEGGFEKVDGISGKVYSIAIDPVQTGTIYVAASGGLKVSRDKGETFTDARTGAMNGAKNVRSVMVTSGKSAKVGIFAATDKGAFASISETGGVAPKALASGDESEDSSGGDDEEGSYSPAESAYDSSATGVNQTMFD